jgi:hypothetical protein
MDSVVLLIPQRIVAYVYHAFGALTVLLLVTSNVFQSTAQAPEKMKTVRLHIYGFSKSKSGAV